MQRVELALKQQFAKLDQLAEALRLDERGKARIEKARRSIIVTERYAHLAPEHTRDALALLEEAAVADKSALELVDQAYRHVGHEVDRQGCCKSLIVWWLRVDSNHRPQHYECLLSVGLVNIFSKLRGTPVASTVPQCTTMQDGFRQKSGTICRRHACQSDFISLDKTD